MTVLASTTATRALQIHRDRIRPEVLRRRGSDPANPYLFPGRGRAERPHSKHTRDYRDRAQAAGFWLDLHCNRHLTAKIVLDRDPAAMPLVQTILGHATQRTTEAYYAEVNQLLAQQRFQEHLLAAERDLTSELAVTVERAST
jgi:integrase